MDGGGSADAGEDEGADGGVGLVVELSAKEGRALDPSKPS